MKPGDELPELRVEPDRYTAIRYAGASGDFNPIHLDDAFAREVGLPSRILHGLWTMAQIARAQTQAAGGPQALARLSVQFRGMALPEGEIAVTTTVADVGDDVVVVHATATQGAKAIVRGAEAELRLGG